ncbi:LADA_0H20208g1_1 [Lachancea dasiensis]|uniref:LADA_0H20208g1_1 n=1 Tax=Lachancea dasiensis TaxID=1072105 RepID=A0A1G4K6M5_9SACH|nr:LADA_0H20208g1_1 [Lachancea dasiensis]
MSEERTIRGNRMGQLKKPHASKFSGGSTMDDGVFDALQDVISGIDLVNEGVSNDYRPVIAFFSGKFGSQILQSWSYHAQVNNHAKFTSCTAKLGRALRVLGSDPSTLACGSTLIRSILQEYIKVLYRGVNNLKPSITNPILRLMRQIVVFNQGQHIDDFLTYFDLGLPSLVRVLGPTKTELADPEQCKTNPELSMRYNFLQFWISMINHSTPLLRKSVLTENPKLMSTWYKHMVKYDSGKLVQQCIRTMIEKVLQEKSLKKVTKCKILNESFISKVHSFYYSSDPELVTLVDYFFELFTTSQQFSVAFHDDKLWFSEPVYSSSNSSYTSNGATVLIKNTKFNLYNKLLFTTLTFFKPWEDEPQLNRVVQVLRSIPELIAPYCYHLNTLGNHEPRMTSYWFGMTLLFGRIINSPIPNSVKEVQTDSTPSSILVMESILPCSLTRQPLTKALLHEVPLVKQMACQLLVFAFKKLETIFSFYDEKGWNSAKSELLNSFKSKVPELSVVSSTLDYVGRNSRENSVLAASVSIVLNHYSRTFPLTFNLNFSNDNIFFSVMNSSTFSGLDLVILDNFLQFQELNSSQTKWYNSTAGENSVFTSLLKLASSNIASSTLTKKVTLLLENLLQFSVVFNESLTASPLAALVNSLQIVQEGEPKESCDQLQKIWKLLDETISRCMKTPYKYMDMATSSENCSPFLVALVEQWGFVDTKTAFDRGLKWLLIFLRSTVFIGEPFHGIYALLEPVPTIPRDMKDVYLNFQEYERELVNLRKPEYLVANDMDNSFFQCVTLTEASTLGVLARFPVNELDVAGLISRLQSILETPNDPIPYLKFTSIVDNLLLKTANYVLSQNDFKVKFTKKFYFSKLVLPLALDSSNLEACKRYSYLTNTITSIYGQLGVDISEYQAYIKELWVSCASTWSEVDVLRSALVSGLTVLSSKQLGEVLTLHIAKGQDLIPDILAEMSLRGVHLANGQLLEILALNDPRIISILETFVKSRLIDSPQFAVLLPMGLQTDVNYPIVEAFLAYDEGIMCVKNFLSMVTDANLMIKIAASLSTDCSEDVNIFINKALTISFERLHSLQYSVFDAALQLFINRFDDISFEQRVKIVNFITTFSEHKFTPQVAKFVACFNNFENSDIQLWIRKSALFITKNFAERSEPSKKFFDFLNNFQELHHQANIWNLGVSSSLNSQAESIVDGLWVAYPEPLKFLGAILLGAEKSKLNSSRILQLLLNNRELCFNSSPCDSHLKFLTASLIYILFIVDPQGCSSPVIQDKLLLFYGGTMTCSDRIILDILKQIESKTLVSWTRNIFAWDYQDSLGEPEGSKDQDYRLLAKEKEGYIMTIRQDLVKETINSIGFDVPSLPILASSESANDWKYFETFESATHLLWNGHECAFYDPTFLLLSIVNNEDFFRTRVRETGEQNDTHFLDMKKIIGNGLLEFIIVCLSLGGEVRDIASSLIYKMLDSLDGGTMKDASIYKILLTKIGFTLYNEKRQQDDDSSVVSPLIWYMVASLSTFLNQPGSFLYEKASRWILSFPFIQAQHVPLLDTIMMMKATDDGENYYRYLHWFLESILHGLKTKDDIKLLKFRNILEWMMNLLNSPYISFKLRSQLKDILYKTQRIETGGATLLTRLAGGSFLETIQQSTSQKLVNVNKELMANNKNKLRLKQTLILQQSQLNNSELGTGFVAIAKSHKRISDWMVGDADNLLKRICTSKVRHFG